MLQAGRRDSSASSPSTQIAATPRGPWQPWPLRHVPLSHASKAGNPASLAKAPVGDSRLKARFHDCNVNAALHSLAIQLRPSGAQPAYTASPTTPSPTAHASSRHVYARAPPDPRSLTLRCSIVDGTAGPHHAAMEDVLNEQFERVEKALTTLVDSIAAYNPATQAAVDLLAADDELSQGLDQRTRTPTSADIDD